MPSLKNGNNGMRSGDRDLTSESGKQLAGSIHSVATGANKGVKDLVKADAFIERKQAEQVVDYYSGINKIQAYEHSAPTARGLESNAQMTARELKEQGYTKSQISEFRQNTSRQLRDAGLTDKEIRAVSSKGRRDWVNSIDIDTPQNALRDEEAANSLNTKPTGRELKDVKVTDDAKNAVHNEVGDRELKSADRAIKENAQAETNRTIKRKNSIETDAATQEVTQRKSIIKGNVEKELIEEEAKTADRTLKSAKKSALTPEKAKLKTKKTDAKADKKVKQKSSFGTSKKVKETKAKAGEIMNSSMSTKQKSAALAELRKEVAKDAAKTTKAVAVKTNIVTAVIDAVGTLFKGIAAMGTGKDEKSALIAGGLIIVILMPMIMLACCGNYLSPRPNEGERPPFGLKELRTILRNDYDHALDTEYEQIASYLNLDPDQVCPTAFNSHEFEVFAIWYYIRNATIDDEVQNQRCSAIDRNINTWMRLMNGRTDYTMYPYNAIHKSGMNGATPISTSGSLVYGWDVSLNVYDINPYDLGAECALDLYDCTLSDLFILEEISGIYNKVYMEPRTHYLSSDVDPDTGDPIEGSGYYTVLIKQDFNHNVALSEIAGNYGLDQDDIDIMNEMIRGEDDEFNLFWAWLIYQSGQGTEELKHGPTGLAVQLWSYFGGKRNAMPAGVYEMVEEEYGDFMISMNSVGVQLYENNSMTDSDKAMFGACPMHPNGHCNWQQYFYHSIGWGGDSAWCQAFVSFCIQNGNGINPASPGGTAVNWGHAFPIHYSWSIDPRLMQVDWNTSMPWHINQSETCGIQLASSDIFTEEEEAFITAADNKLAEIGYDPGDQPIGNGIGFDMQMSAFQSWLDSSNTPDWFQDDSCDLTTITGRLEHYANGCPANAHPPATEENPVSLNNNLCPLIASSLAPLTQDEIRLIINGFTAGTESGGYSWPYILMDLANMHSGNSDTGSANVFAELSSAQCETLMTHLYYFVSNDMIPIDENGQPDTSFDAWPRRAWYIKFNDPWQATELPTMNDPMYPGSISLSTETYMVSVGDWGIAETTSTRNRAYWYASAGAITDYNGWGSPGGSYDGSPASTASYVYLGGQMYRSADWTWNGSQSVDIYYDGYTWVSSNLFTNGMDDGAFSWEHQQGYYVPKFSAWYWEGIANESIWGYTADGGNPGIGLCGGGWEYQNNFTDLLLAVGTGVDGSHRDDDGVWEYQPMFNLFWEIPQRQLCWYQPGAITCTTSFNTYTYPKYTATECGGVQSGEWYPGPGDLIYYDYDKDGSINHVGIVLNTYEYNGNHYVVSIEGNSSDTIVMKSFMFETAAAYGTERWFVDIPY